MMGEKGRAFQMHHALSLDGLIPADHFYRRLEKTLDLAFVRDLVREYYAAGGRPSIDPVVFFKTRAAIAERPRPFEEELARLDTIPGVDRRLRRSCWPKLARTW